MTNEIALGAAQLRGSQKLLASMASASACPLWPEAYCTCLGWRETEKK